MRLLEQGLSFGFHEPLLFRKVQILCTASTKDLSTPENVRLLLKILQVKLKFCYRCNIYVFSKCTFEWTLNCDVKSIHT